MNEKCDFFDNYELMVLKSFRLPVVSFGKSSELFLNLLIEKRILMARQKIREMTLRINCINYYTYFCSMIENKILCICVVTSVIFLFLLFSSSVRSRELDLIFKSLF